jgi:hypothetical protein
MVCGGDSGVICGEVCGIRIYSLSGRGNFHQGSYRVILDPFHLEQRIYIPIEDCWVSCIYYDKMWNKILGSCDTELKKH